MSLDPVNLLSDDSLILDWGTVNEIPDRVMRRIPSHEIGLREAWDLIDLGTHLRFLRKNSNSERLKPFWLTYEEVMKSINDFSTYFWLPYGFNDIDHATIGAMDRYSVMVMDVDSDVDIMFWQKTRDIIKEWSSTGISHGIIVPTMICFSGNGIHPYWKIFTIELDKLKRNVAKVIQYVLRCKFSMYFTRKPLHKLNLNQSYRIPESFTKSGERCRAFMFDNGFRGSFEDFIRSVVTPEETEILLGYINGKYSAADLISIQTRYGLMSGIEREKKNPSPKGTEKEDSVHVETPLAPNMTDIFDARSIQRFSDIIESDPTTIKKSFAKKVIFSLKQQSPIREGNRTLRMLGLAIALSPHKAGTCREILVQIVNMANNQFCNPPLLQHEIANVCKDPDQYKFCSERRLKEFLGISHWPAFIRIESIMNRQQAGKNAAEITQHRCIHKLVQSYLELGFNVSISKLCSHSEVSRQTFFRYRENGMLRAIFNWLIQHGALSDKAKSELQRHLYRFKENLGRLSDEDAEKINEFLLGIKSNPTPNPTS